LRPKVLILTDWYVPGYKAGGPIQSIKNLVEHMSDVIDFSIVTGDRDLLDIKPYEVEMFDAFISHSNHRICYTTKSNRQAIIKREILSSDYSQVYLNSMFSVDFSLRPLGELLRKGGLNKVVLAPRGMLGAGAIAIKPIKKKLFLLAFKSLRIHTKIRIHSTDNSETIDIQKILGPKAEIVEIFNLPAKLSPRQPVELTDIPKFIFASRVSPKKNLDFAIRMLAKLNMPCQLEVYGAIDDHDYAERCKSIKRNLLKIEFHDPIKHETLMNEVAQCHFFILPTKNENFGHSIIEAMSLGVPVIISDQTPWTEIESSKAGRSLSLDSEDEWVNALMGCMNMSNDEYREMCRKSVEYVQQKLSINEICEQYLNLFRG